MLQLLNFQAINLVDRQKWAYFNYSSRNILVIDIDRTICVHPSLWGFPAC
jgi:hypothetical protein